MDDEALLSRVAWYYHHDGLTQQEIGQRLGLSRIRVSRLLEKGKRTGVIGITINSRYRGCLELENRLRETYGLRDAIVIPPLDAGPRDHTVHVNERLAQAAASYLMNFLVEGSLLAIGWGDTVTRTLDRLGYLLGHTGASVMTLTGGVSTYVHMVGGLNASLAQAHRLFMIPSPLVVASRATADSLRSEPAVRDVLGMATTANYALVGIGAMNETASFVRGGYVSTADMVRYRQGGAVGDLLGRFLDGDGRVLDLEIHDRIVGVDLPTLGRMPCVIGAAGGPQKSDAIRATLSGGYLDIVITDAPTATAILG